VPPELSSCVRLPSEPRSPEARRRLVLDGEVLLQSSRIPQSIGVAVITNIPPAVRNLDGPDDDSRRQVAGMLGNLSPSGGRVRWTKTGIQVDPLLIFVGRERYSHIFLLRRISSTYGWRMLMARTGLVPRAAANRRDVEARLCMLRELYPVGTSGRTRTLSHFSNDLSWPVPAGSVLPGRGPEVRGNR
jgi:hypothetical protein